MLEIGNEVRITTGVTILTHDYSWSVWKRISGEIVGGVGKVKIGNNVFIGMNAVILMNTEIGDNVVIGAGSIVSGKVESNSVYAGNPAVRLMSIEDYVEKRKQRMKNDAKKIARAYYERLCKIPPKSALPAYFWLFEKNAKDLDPVFESRMHLCGNYEESVRALEEHTPVWNSYEEFIEEVLEGVPKKGSTQK